MILRKEKASEVLDLFRRMWLIRAFEEKASVLYAERQIAGLLHLSIGQEAIAVGACSLLHQDDYVFGGHRSHGHGELSVIIPLVNTTPLFAVLFSAVFLRNIETVNRRIVFGALTMVSGVLLITIR